MARQKMNWLMLTFRTKEHKNSKETVTTETRKGTRVRIAELPRRIKPIRVIRRETDKRNTVITALVMSVEAECFRKPGNPGYKEFKPKG